MERGEKQGYSLRDISNLTAQISEGAEISPLLARMLGSRGISTADQARHFLYGDLSSLPSPSLLLDLDLAVERIVRAIVAGEKGMVMADFDCDGIVAAAIVTHTRYTGRGVEKRKRIEHYVWTHQQ